MDDLMYHTFSGDPWGPCTRCAHPSYHKIHSPAAEAEPEPGSGRNIAAECGWQMRGVYGAITRCARPAGHMGAHDGFWREAEWPDCAASGVSDTIKHKPDKPPENSSN